MDWINSKWIGTTEVSIEQYECEALKYISNVKYIYSYQILEILQIPEYYGLRPKDCTKQEMINIFTDTLCDLYGEVM